MLYHAGSLGSVSSSPENPKAQELAKRLDKLDSDTVQAKQDVLNRLRVPTERRDPIGDLTNRVKGQEVKESSIL